MKVFLFALGMFLMCNALLAWCCLRAGSISEYDYAQNSESKKQSLR